MAIQYSIQPLRGFKEYLEIQQTGSLSGLQIHAFVLEVVLPPIFSFAEKTRAMKIITLYGPQQRLLWWNWRINLLTREERVPSSGEKIRDQLLGKRWSVQLSNRQITGFTCSAHKVYIIESSETWDSYEDAYQSIILSLEKEAQKVIEGKGEIKMLAFRVSARSSFLNFIENGQLYCFRQGYNYKVISLDQYITDPHFYHTKCIGNPVPKTKITVRKHDTEWHVELTGASQKTAIFILDENYEVLDVSGKAVEGPFICEPIDGLSLYPM